MRLIGMRQRQVIETISRLLAPPALLALAAFTTLFIGCSGSVAPTEITDPPPALPPGSTLTLGTLQTNSAQDALCPPGTACQGIAVSCAGVAETIPGFVAVSNPTGTPRGVVVFTTGSGGETYALAGNQRTALLDQLRADGFRVVQLRWDANWIEAVRNNDAGTSRLACRPATAFKWIYDTHFAPLGIARSANGRCGFCITGNSGGATQVSFALSHYGLESILDGGFPTGGPPHAALAKACLRAPGEEGFWFAPDTRAFIDRGFGIYDNGPCFRNDPSMATRWSQESVATGGTDYTHPATRIHFIRGELDDNMRAPSEAYLTSLQAAGSPWVSMEIAAGTPHAVLGSETGRNAVRAALLASR